MLPARAGDLRQTAGCPADHVQQPKARPILPVHGAQPAALAGAQQQQKFPVLLPAPSGQLCSHKVLCRLYPGQCGGSVLPAGSPADDLCPHLGVGIALGAKVEHLFGPGHGFQPGFHQGPGGSIRAHQQPTAVLQRLHHGGSKVRVPFSVQVSRKAAVQTAAGLVQPGSIFALQRDQRLRAPAAALGGHTPLRRESRRRLLYPQRRCPE